MKKYFITTYNGNPDGFNRRCYVSDEVIMAEDVHDAIKKVLNSAWEEDSLNHNTHILICRDVESKTSLPVASITFKRPGVQHGTDFETIAVSHIFGTSYSSACFREHLAEQHGYELNFESPDMAWSVWSSFTECLN